MAEGTFYPFSRHLETKTARKEPTRAPSLHADNPRGSLLLVAPIGDSDHRLPQIEESLPRDRVHVESRRRARIPLLADALHDGYLRQQRAPHLLGQLLAAVFAEDVVAVFRQMTHYCVSRAF